MLNRILIVALIAGFVSGVAVTAIQLGSSIPIIQYAESFENANGDGVAVGGHNHADEPSASSHGHNGSGVVAEREPWAPEDGIERVFWTGTTNVLLGFGAALLMAAGLLLHGLFVRKPVNSLIGLAWGWAAFLTFSLAPAMGLPPELPGTAAAELELRQLWWIATVVATAGGLAMIAYCRWLWMAPAVGLLLLPHVIGAPHPEVHESLVPASVEETFIVISVGTSMIFWLMLGSLTASLVRRMNLIDPAPISETSAVATAVGDDGA